MNDRSKSHGGRFLGWRSPAIGLALVLVWGSIGAVYALGDRPVTASDMKGVEFGWGLPLAWGFRNQSEVFPPAAAEKLKGITVRSGVHRVMEVVYFDTPSKTLGNQGLILRVRKELTRPDKSRITLKSRHRDLSRLLFIPYTKGEVDVKGGQVAYSLSLDSNFRNADLDLAKVTGREFLDYLARSHRRIHAEVMAALGDQASNLKRTPLVHLHRFRGEIAEGPGRGTEVDIDVIGASGSRQALAAELTFKIRGGDPKRGERMVAWMNEMFKAAGVSGGSGGSKTSRVLDLGLR